MTTSEKFCLKWNDFQVNINTAFSDLRKDSNFTDVTLACQDGYQVGAHKVILAASGPFFQNLLKRNKHAHPLIYMRGIRSEDLLAIVDFLYHGEANIYQDNLESFLNLAEDLQLKGLNGSTEGGGEGGGNDTKHQKGTYKPIGHGTGIFETSETQIPTHNNLFLAQAYSSLLVMRLPFLSMNYP